MVLNSRGIDPTMKNTCSMQKARVNVTLELWRCRFDSPKQGKIRWTGAGHRFVPIYALVAFHGESQSFLESAL